MKRIGLTGGIATGKSTVARYCSDQGIPVIAADALVHELYAADAGVRRQIITRFGPDVATPEGLIDRTRLGERVFADAAARQQLEHIVHPLVRQRIAALAHHQEAQGAACALFDIPLLFESHDDWHFDAIIVARCSPDTQIRRVMQRYGCNRPHAEQRIASQLPLAEKVARADYVVETEGTPAETRAQVERILAWLVNGS